MYNFTQHIISCSNEWHISKYNYKQSFLHVHNHKTYFTMFNSVIDRKNRALLNCTVSHRIIILTKFYDFILGKPWNYYIYKSCYGCRTISASYYKVVYGIFMLYYITSSLRDSEKILVVNSGQKYSGWNGKKQKISIAKKDIYFDLLDIFSLFCFALDVKWDLIMVHCS